MPSSDDALRVSRVTCFEAAQTTLGEDGTGDEARADKSPTGVNDRCLNAAAPPVVRPPPSSLTRYGLQPTRAERVGHTSKHPFAPLNLSLLK